MSLYLIGLINGILSIGMGALGYRFYELYKNYYCYDEKLDKIINETTPLRDFEDYKKELDEYKDDLRRELNKMKRDFLKEHCEYDCSQDLELETKDSIFD